jgi:hypothetical protein
MMLWDLKTDFHKFLANLFGSMDACFGILRLISKRFYGFLWFYKYNMGFDFLQVCISMGQQLTNFLAFWAWLMHVIFCGYVWCVVGSRSFKTFQVFFGVLLMCGDNNHKLHDLCACVDV